MERILDLSHKFVLSSGAVPIDVAENLVLLLYHRSKGEYFLPKGRKQAGESLEDAALRETMEESGYKCTLLRHCLPTKALGHDSPHQEPIAVQQRHDGYVRKVIFWYAAQVDSNAQQKECVQEEGEDFEVRWANTEDAASLMSFVDDREIVERALDAMRANPLFPSNSGSAIQEHYLNESIDPRSLGFLCISLGGSVVYRASPLRSLQHVQQSTDWDGFGILELKADIVALVNELRPELCRLLLIEKEECPYMRVSVPSLCSTHKAWY